MKPTMVILVLVALLGSIVPQSAWSEDEEAGVRKHGVVYNIAGDRKIVRIGGKYEPEGIDLYIKRSLDNLRSDVKSLGNQISKLSEQLVEIEGYVRNTLGEVQEMKS